jgi:hypothetical protein
LVYIEKKEKPMIHAEKKECAADGSMGGYAGDDHTKVVV